MLFNIGQILRREPEVIATIYIVLLIKLMQLPIKGKMAKGVLFQVPNRLPQTMYVTSTANIYFSQESSLEIPGRRYKAVWC